MNSSGIYQIVCHASGNRYIGSAVHFGNRWRLHRSHLRRGLHHSPHLQRAWVKYGAEAFSFSPLLICARPELLYYEQRALDAFSPEYNVALRAGSPRGIKPTDEARAKMRAAKLGRPLSAAHRAAIAAANTGKPRSAEAIEKTRIKRLGMRLGPLSAEHKAKQSASLRGRRLSAAHVEKIRRAKTGAPRPDMLGNRYGAHK